MENIFKPNDIVWVKLGPFWWPGEVVDKTKVPEEVTESLKWEPVAIVKFFQDEEFFECVKSEDTIRPYNCERKNDFIRKGMAAFRAKNPKLKFFPRDVSAAEIKIDGNPNILSDPMFTPDKNKRNIETELFGSPSTKKTKHIKKNRSPKKIDPVITHRRFLGYDDYKAHILIQGTGDREPDAVEIVHDDEDSSTGDKKCSFTCPICEFDTDRMGILMMHTKCHVQGAGQILGPLTPKKVPKQQRKRKKASSEDDEDNDNGEKAKTKRKYKKREKTAATSGADESALADDEKSENDNSLAEFESPRNREDAIPKNNVCGEIIADWDEDISSPTPENEIETSILDSTTEDEIGKSTMDTGLDEDLAKIIREKDDENAPEEAKEQPVFQKPKEKESTTSCFDFDDNEDETHVIPDASSGRKIPRVIPVTDKRKSFSFDEDDEEKEKETTEEEITKKKILQESKKLAESDNDPKDEELDDLEETYKSLMESTTSKIELPDVPNVLKSQQNFHCAKTVKYPDKIVTTEIADEPENSRIEVAEQIPRSQLDVSKNDIEIVHVEQKCEVPSSEITEQEVCDTSDASKEQKPSKRTRGRPRKKVTDESATEASASEVEEDQRSTRQKKKRNEEIGDAVVVATPTAEQTKKQRGRGRARFPEKSEIISSTNEKSNVPPKRMINEAEIDLLLAKYSVQFAEEHHEEDEDLTVREYAEKRSEPVVEETKKTAEKPKKAVKDTKKVVEETKKAVEETKTTVDKPKKVEEETKKTLQETKEAVEKPKNEGEEIKNTVDETNKAVKATKKVEETKKTVEKPKKVAEETKKTLQESKEAGKKPKNEGEEIENTVDETKKAVQEPKEAVEKPKQEADEIEETVVETKKADEEPKKAEEETKKTVEEIEKPENEIKSKAIAGNKEARVLDDASKNETCEDIDVVSIDETVKPRRTRKYQKIVKIDEKENDKKCTTEQPSIAHADRSIEPIISSSSATNKPRGSSNERQGSSNDSTAVANEATILEKSQTEQRNNDPEDTNAIITSADPEGVVSPHENLIEVEVIDDEEKETRKSLRKNSRKQKSAIEENVEPKIIDPYQTKDNVPVEENIIDKCSSVRSSPRRGRTRKKTEEIEKSTEHKPSVTHETKEEVKKSTENKPSGTHETKEEVKKSTENKPSVTHETKEEIKKSTENKPSVTHEIKEEIEKEQEVEKAEMEDEQITKDTTLKNDVDTPAKEKKNEEEKVVHSVIDMEKDNNTPIKKYSKKDDEHEAKNNSPREDKNIHQHHSSQKKRNKRDLFSIDTPKEENDQHRSSRSDRRSSRSERKSSGHERSPKKIEHFDEKLFSVEEKDTKKSPHISLNERRSTRWDHRKEEKEHKKDEKDHKRDEKDNKKDEKNIKSERYSSHRSHRSRKSEEKEEHKEEIKHDEDKHRSSRRSKREKLDELKSIFDGRKVDKEDETSKKPEKHRKLETEPQHNSASRRKDGRTSKDTKNGSSSGNLLAESSLDENKSIIESEDIQNSKQDNSDVTSQQLPNIEVNKEIETNVVEIQDTKIEVSREEKLPSHKFNQEKEIDEDHIKSNEKQEEEDNKKKEDISKETNMIKLDEKTQIEHEQPSTSNLTALEKETSPDAFGMICNTFSTKEKTSDPKKREENIRDALSMMRATMISEMEAENAACYAKTVDESVSDLKEQTPSKNVEIKPKTSNLTGQGNVIIFSGKERHEKEKSKRTRPSRWDQKERPAPSADEPEKNKDERVLNRSEEPIDTKVPEIDSFAVEETFTETKEIGTEKSIDDGANSVEKSKDEIVDESTIGNAAQIEAIFGSSPLPKLTEDHVFPEDQKKILAAKTPEKLLSDVGDIPLPQETTVDVSPTPRVLSDDLLESVESQVARITHYEEPNAEEKSKPQQQKHQLSIFDTPEKKDDENSIETSTPESKIGFEQDDVEKKRPKLFQMNLKPADVEDDPTKLPVAHKTKKNYLLVNKSKLESMSVSNETSDINDKQHQQKTEVAAASKPLNEVATKLTNPKKRFVKSFEDFELNQQKEKSTAEAKAAEEKTEKSEVNTNSKSVVGKSPIAFKLKKQFLSKISSIFDDENDEDNKATKLKLPKVSLGFSIDKEETTTSKQQPSVSTSPVTKEAPQKVEEKPPTPDDSLFQHKKPTENLRISIDKSLLKNQDIIDKAVELKAAELSKSSKEKRMDENSIAGPSHQIRFVADETSPIEFDIKTNLSNIGQPDGLGDITSLLNVPPIDSETKRKKDDTLDDTKIEIITKSFPLDDKKEEEPELVELDGNLTVVSEKELAEGQVEITTGMPVKNKKPATLMSFSMDFSDDSNDASFEVFKKEKIMGIADSLDITRELEETKTEKVDHKLPDLPIINDVDVVAKIPEQFLSPNTTSNDNKTDNNKIAVGENHELTLEDILGTSKVDLHQTTEVVNPADSQPVKPNEVKETLHKIKETPKKTQTATPKGKSAQKNIEAPKDRVNEPVVIYNTAKSSTVTDLCDLEDHIPSQIVCSKQALMNEEVRKVAGIANEMKKEGSVADQSLPASKLLIHLTPEKVGGKNDSDEAKKQKKESEPKSTISETVATKHLVKTALKIKTTATPHAANVPATKTGNKAIILSEKIIRPAYSMASLKRSFEDVEAASSPQKNQKLESPLVSKTPTIKSTIHMKQQMVPTTAKQVLTVPNKPKAKILNQTIIRPASDVVQPKEKNITIDDNADFDINSMPIVLSDELLTAESLESMPIVLSDNMQKNQTSDNLKLIIDKRKSQQTPKVLNKTMTLVSGTSPTMRLQIAKKMQPQPKILQTPGQPQKRIATPMPKTGKYIILNENLNKPVQAVKPNLVRRSLPAQGIASNQNVSTENTGHKIMIVTNQQGQQQRVLLTPAQQKQMGMQFSKTTKTIMKGTATQKITTGGNVQTSGVTLPSTSKTSMQGIVSTPKTIRNQMGVSQAMSQHMKLVQARKQQKICVPQHSGNRPPQTQKTILVRTQQGQTMRKIQVTDEALEKQVAEQIKAIKASSKAQQMRQQEPVAKAATAVAANRSLQSTMVKKPYTKRSEMKPILQTRPASSTIASTVSGLARAPNVAVPALTPIRKPEDTVQKNTITEFKTPTETTVKPPDRPLNQIVIQDGQGNQTTVTEGQILALPSETVDGQPQSYVLVTVDESGNLTPLNNEALMSLDPSLVGLTGGDPGNMVLQIDGTGSKDGAPQTLTLAPAQEKPKVAAPVPVVEHPPPQQQQQQQQQLLDTIHKEQQQTQQQSIQSLMEQQPTATQVQVTCNINGETSQQILLTGDPAATQKFLDSITDGTTDLASLLSNAEGNSFLIQMDGQQILVNTDPNGQNMLTNNLLDHREQQQQQQQVNPMFPAHIPGKNQDILAAALADTDVFQPEQMIGDATKPTTSQLSPLGQNLFPIKASNVIETSTTLNSPIMAIQESPSNAPKKMITEDEADVLSTRVPKNVDLPITVTDPNISQTVSHQQALMSGDLQTNLELTLPLSETQMSVGAELNSPSSFGGYSLPNLDVVTAVDVVGGQKTFGGSMPLLTEDMDEVLPMHHHDDDSTTTATEAATVTPPSPQTCTAIDAAIMNDPSKDERFAPSIDVGNGESGGIGSFIEEGLCTLGGEMCSSLSEPPPEMFDIPISGSGGVGGGVVGEAPVVSLGGFLTKSDDERTDNALMTTDDNSMEIPVQPQIVADLKDDDNKDDFLGGDRGTTI